MRTDRLRPFLTGLLATALLLVAPALGAQVAQTAARADGRVPTVQYVVQWRTEFLSKPATTAPVIAWLDSAQVVTPTSPEKYENGHAQIVVNGRTGWVDNGYITRRVVLRDTARVVDTVRVTRGPAPSLAPPRRSGAMGQPSAPTIKKP